MDGYNVEPVELTAASEAFAGQQATPTRLVSTLEGARAVDTGDPGLDGGIQGIVDQLTAALTGLATGLGQDSAGLTRMVQAYQAQERSAADALGAIESRL
ncbi:MAG TPA: hypothetical protein VOB72_24720 [Candidatus Dormibacteraeota bacterium]|nr:hypothetical protein [Candidatus Dormibacteraeota bacterium]